MNSFISVLRKTSSYIVLVGMLPLTVNAQDISSDVSSGPNDNVFQMPKFKELQKQIDTLKDKVETLSDENQSLMENSQGRLNSETVQSSDTLNVKWDPIPRFTSNDGRFSFRLNARVTYDYANISFKDGGGNSRPENKVNGTHLRHLEMGFRGKMFNDFSYRVSTKFVNNEVEVKLAYVDYTLGNTNLTLGQTRTYTTFDKLSSPPKMTYSERFAFINALRMKPRIGVSASQHGDDWSITGGYFFENAATSNNALDDNNMASGRVTYSPSFENGMRLHFGSSFFYRNENGKVFNKGYSTRAVSKQGDYKPLYSGEFNIKSEKFIGGEFVATYGSFGIQAEYATVKNTLNETETLTNRNPSYQGGYIDFGFFPTGGERVVDGKDGRYDSVYIKNPVGEGGFGEVRLGVRYDFADFTHETFGRKQNSYIIAADWFLNDYMKIQTNYAHSIIKNYADIKTDTVDTFNLRFMMNI